MDIFGQEPTLASDSEWLLQSGDASVESLAEVLTNEHFQFIYHFALMLTGEPPTARGCALQALAEAISKASHYSAAISLRAWLAGFCLQACIRSKKLLLFDIKDEQPGDRLDHLFWLGVHGLSQAERLTFILHSYFEFPIHEAAKICHQENSVLERSLNLNLFTYPSRITARCSGSNDRANRSILEGILESTLASPGVIRTRFATHQPARSGSGY